MVQSPASKQTPPGRRAKVISLICLLLGGALLGLATNLAKLAGEVALSPLAFLAWSIVGAALILLSISALRRDLPPWNSRALEYYAVSALVGVAGPNLIFFSAIPHVGASFVAMIISLPPLLTYVGALALRMERFRVVRVTGVIAALTGALALAAGQYAAPNADKFWILIAVIGPVLLAIGNLYRTLRWPPGASGDALATGMVIAAALMLLAASSMPSFSLTVPTENSLPVILIAIQSVVFAGMFLLLFILQKTGGPVLLSLLGSVGALVGVPVAILLQGEAPPENLMLGAALIAAGIALLTLDQTKRTRKQANTEAQPRTSSY